MTAQDIPEFDPFIELDWNSLFGLADFGSTLRTLGPGMFLPLSGQLDRYEAELRRPSPALSAFFARVKEKISDADYAHVQKRHLNREAIAYLVASMKEWAAWGTNSPAEKYLNFTAFAVSKFQHAVRLGLHKSPPLDILDLGAGPGHFALVCDYFGHRCLGLDVPLEPTVPSLDRHLYHDLCDLFGVATIAQAIEAQKPLDLPRRFDRVTCWMGKFHRAHRVSESGDAEFADWDVNDWAYLLRDLKTNALKDEFEIHLQLAPIKDAGVMDFLSTRSTGGNAERFLFVYDETSAI